MWLSFLARSFGDGVVAGSFEIMWCLFACHGSIPNASWHSPSEDYHQVWDEFPRLLRVSFPFWTFSYLLQHHFLSLVTVVFCKRWLFSSTDYWMCCSCFWLSVAQGKWGMMFLAQEIGIYVGWSPAYVPAWSLILMSTVCKLRNETERL